MEYYKEVNFLPDIPDKFFKPYQEILDNVQEKDIGAHLPDEGSYAITVHDADQELLEYLQPYFEGKIAVRWQIITRDLQLHIDWGKCERKFLYVYDQGGENVKTQFWSYRDDDNLNGDWITEDDRDIKLEVQIPTKQWAQLNVKAPHKVINVDHVRYSLLIRENYSILPS